MTLEQFKEALIEDGYKLKSVQPNFESYKKRNKRVCIQEYDTHTNVFYDKEGIQTSIEYIQFRIVDFEKALSNIKTFERKIRG